MPDQLADNPVLWYEPRALANPEQSIVTENARFRMALEAIAALGTNIINWEQGYKNARAIATEAIKETIKR